jgi:hypothetical protein
MKSLEAQMKNTLFLILLIGSALLLSGCFGPRLDVLSQQTTDTTVDIRSRFGDEIKKDYAIKYTVQVRNKGEKGKVRAMAKLYTSEGQFYREQVIDIESNQDKTLEFVFTEPTVPGTVFGQGNLRTEFSYESVE